ncbi:CBO0543 family protein [Robertmurraya sp.]|uniref:CBO0543 family protein n=1 Tax=Robertmurraya sp. TaxID=2837525 RepID=UPI00370401D7
MPNIEDYLKKADKVYDRIAAVHDDKLELWIDHVVFTWQWWLGVFLTVIPWVIWFYVRKKDSTFRLITAGMFVIIISSWLDFVGVVRGFWHYNYDVIPTLPAFIPWDFTLLPVTVMLFLQFKPQMNPLIKGIVFAALSSFVGEPLFVWLKVYEPEKWKYIYSFPILICIYLIAYFISKRNEFEKIKND